MLNHKQHTHKSYTTVTTHPLVHNPLYTTVTTHPLVHNPLSSTVTTHPLVHNPLYSTVTTHPLAHLSAACASRRVALPVKGRVSEEVLSWPQSTASALTLAWGAATGSLCATFCLTKHSFWPATFCLRPTTHSLRPATFCLCPTTHSFWPAALEQPQATDTQTDH